MRSHNFLTNVFVVTLLVIGSAEAGFKAINNYLIERVQNEDIYANMKAAADWLKRLEDSKQSFLFSKNIMKDLKQFTSLQHVLDQPTKCDRTDFKIMRDNQLASGGSNSVRRIDRVMQAIFLEHAKKCSEVYPMEFRKLKDQFGSQAYERVENIGVAIKAEDLEWEGNIYDLDDIMALYVLNDYSLSQSNYGNSLLDALEFNARGHPDLIYAKKLPDERSGKMVIHEDKVRLLVKEHLVKPCKEYVTLFGMNLFVLARFDAQYHSPNQDEANSDFYNGWADYSICRSIVEKERVAIRDVIETIARRSNS